MPGDVYALGVILYQVLCGDLLASLSPGWESRISDPLLRQDIAEAADVDPKLRTQTAAELAHRLRTLDHRRAQAAQQKEILAAAQRAEKAQADARLRRPWIIFAVAALIVGLCASLLYYRRAAHARDLAEQQSATNAAMFHFLADDLLGQSNPFGKAANTNQPQQQTLLQAIEKAVPSIDRRFQAQPATAGRLHETIAEALTNQTNFTQADPEYNAAAQHFRQAEGPNSPNAILAELKRASTLAASNLPGALQKATEIYQSQKPLVARTPNPSQEMTAWLAAAEAAAIGSGPHPEQALPDLENAVHQAEANSTFDPTLRLLLRRRLTYVYIRLGEGPKAEAEIRQYQAETVALEGPDSPKLLWGQLNLQEALMMQHKHKEVVLETTRAYPRFVQLLGPSSMYSLQTLATRAASEGNLKDYEASIKDDLELQKAAMDNPSAISLQTGGYIDASLSECRIHRYAVGIGHARLVLKQSKAQAGSPSGVTSGAAFALAECLLSQYEDPSARHNPADLAATRSLLDSIDIPAVAHYSADPGFEGDVDIAQARLALAQKQYKQAKDFAAKAHPFFTSPDADVYEKETLARVESALAHAPDRE